MRWLERALLLIGLLALGIYAYDFLDAHIYDYRQSRKLEAALVDSPSGPPPARETDALDSFQGSAPPPEPPGPEGSLLGRIEIPSAGVSALVLEGIDKKTLRRGAGHIPGTPLPRWNGNVGLAAHRDSFFRGLKDIGKNDIITLETLDGTYRYQVAWTEIVRPEDTHVLEETAGPALTLVTCYPFYYVGSAPKRFIVRALRVDAALEPSGAKGVQ